VVRTGGGADHAACQIPAKEDFIMRGRRPAGPEFVQHLSGSPLSKNRAQMILETMNGSCTITEACQLLDLSPARFFQLRADYHCGGLDRIELQAAGRPAHLPSPLEEQNQQLRQRVAELEAALKISQVREELALVLPQVGQASAEKKTRRRTGKKSPSSAKNT
jgi:hypothetical protein